MILVCHNLISSNSKRIPLGDEHVVKFKGRKTHRDLYFTREQYEKIARLKNLWIDSPILNKSGLAEKVWSDSDISKYQLRRRLEQKGERGTFTNDEKHAIKKAVREFYNDVIGSMG